MEAMDKIAEDVEDAARRHSSSILYFHVYKLRENSQSGPVLGKDRIRPGKGGRRLRSSSSWYSINSMCSASWFSVARGSVARRFSCTRIQLQGFNCLGFSYLSVQLHAYLQSIIDIRFQLISISCIELLHLMLQHKTVKKSKLLLFVKKKNVKKTICNRKKVTKW